MPATNPANSSRKRTLSIKAATNGDPNAERKRQKLEEIKKRATKTTLTPKETTNIPSKKTATAGKTAKQTAQPPVDVEDIANNDCGDNGDDSDIYKEVSPEVIDVDDHDAVAIPEEPEESAEAQLGKYFSFFSYLN